MSKTEQSKTAMLLFGFAVFFMGKAVVDFFSFAALEYALENRLMLFRISQLMKIYVIIGYLLLFILTVLLDKRLKIKRVSGSMITLACIATATALNYYKDPLVENVLNTYLNDTTFWDHMSTFNLGAAEKIINDHLFYGFTGFIVLVLIYINAKTHIFK